MSGIISNILFIMVGGTAGSNRGTTDPLSIRSFLSDISAMTEAVALSTREYRRPGLLRANISVENADFR